MEIHHHSHTSKKKWTHYFWEFLMLFLAVTLGFFVENQREHYIEHQRAKVLINSLLNDLQHDTAQLNMLVERRKAKRLILDSLSDLLQTPPKSIDESTFYRLIAQSGSYFKFSQSTGTISQLKNAGYLRYFSDNDLIRNISNYEFWIQDYKGDEDIELAWITERFVEFKVFGLDNSILTGQFMENKIPSGTGVVFYTPDGLRNLKAIVTQLRGDNYYMQSYQAPRLKAAAEQLMNYLHEKYHLK